MIHGSIVWSEGMFIAPQHFQHFDVTLAALRQRGGAA